MTFNNWNERVTQRWLVSKTNWDEQRSPEIGTDNRHGSVTVIAGSQTEALQKGARMLRVGEGLLTAERIS